jgi:hypothetical protein
VLRRPIEITALTGNLDPSTKMCEFNFPEIYGEHRIRKLQISNATLSCH